MGITGIRLILGSIVLALPVVPVPLHNICNIYRIKAKFDGLRY